MFQWQIQNWALRQWHRRGRPLGTVVVVVVDDFGSSRPTLVLPMVSIVDVNASVIVDGGGSGGRGE